MAIFHQQQQQQVQQMQNQYQPPQVSNGGAMNGSGSNNGSNHLPTTNSQSSLPTEIKHLNEKILTRTKYGENFVGPNN